MVFSTGTIPARLIWKKYRKTIIIPGKSRNRDTQGREGKKREINGSG
jgi:hypothetical protein